MFSMGKLLQRIYAGTLMVIPTMALSEPLDALPTYSHVDILMGKQMPMIERLHRLELGEVDSVRHSMISELSQVIVESKLLLDRGDIPDHQRDRLSKMLVLLAVMMQKDNIVEWKNSDEISAILSWAREENPSEYSRLACFDWSQPMWIGGQKPC